MYTVNGSPSYPTVRVIATSDPPTYIIANLETQTTITNIIITAHTQIGPGPSAQFSNVFTTLTEPRECTRDSHSYRSSLPTSIQHRHHVTETFFHEFFFLPFPSLLPPPPLPETHLIVLVPEYPYASSSYLCCCCCCICCCCCVCVCAMEHQSIEHRANFVFLLYLQLIWAEVIWEVNMYKMAATFNDMCSTLL